MMSGDSWVWDFSTLRDHSQTLLSAKCRANILCVLDLQNLALEHSCVASAIEAVEDAGRGSGVQIPEGHGIAWMQRLVSWFLEGWAVAWRLGHCFPSSWPHRMHYAAAWFQEGRRLRPQGESDLVMVSFQGPHLLLPNSSHYFLHRNMEDFKAKSWPGHPPVCT